MISTSIRRRIGMATAATALAIGVSGMAAPAGAAEPIPPQSCGVVRHEVGPLSSRIHRLEPILLRLGVAYPVHDLNCTLVINLEQALGLQPKPPGPFDSN